MLRSSLDRIVVGMIGLDDDTPPQQAASRPTSNLCKQLKCALARTEIRKIERCIRRDDTNQSDEWQIQPLGNHLRADEHISGTGGEALQDVRMSCMGAGSITIPALQPSVRPALTHHSLDPLGP